MPCVMLIRLRARQVRRAQHTRQRWQSIRQASEAASFTPNPVDKDEGTGLRFADDIVGRRGG